MKIKKVLGFWAIAVVLLLICYLEGKTQTSDCVRGNLDFKQAPFEFKDYFVDNQGNIWGAGGSGEISVTSPQKAPKIIKLETKSDFNDIYFIGQIGYLVGTKGTVFKTIDYGESWTKQKTSVDTELNEIFCISQDSCWIAGNNGLVLKTTDGGKNWHCLKTNTTKNLFSISFANYQTGWAVGKDGVIIKTIDGGKNWIEQNISFDKETSQAGEEGWASIDNTWKKVTFNTSQYGCVLGLNKVACTLNGGEKWNLNKFNKNVRLNFVSVFFQENEVKAIEECGKDFLSFDYGNSWIKAIYTNSERK